MWAVREMLSSRLDDPAQRFDIELALRLYFAGRGIDARVGVTDPCHQELYQDHRRDGPGAGGNV
jgi:hypothetical protein